MTYRSLRNPVRIFTSARKGRWLLTGLLMLSCLAGGSFARLGADDQSYQAAFTPATPQQQADMDTVKQRLIDTWIPWQPANSIHDAAAQMRADGSYPDIDYVTVPNANFPAAVHVKRLEYMALAYANPKSPLYKSSDLGGKISKGLDYWYLKDPQTNHHWFMTMGMPLDLAEVLLLYQAGGGQLTPDQLKLGLRMIERGYANGQYDYEYKPATGQNLVWTARAQFMAGLAQSNYTFALNAIKAIQANMKITRQEGVQPDYSFLQHGPLLYSGGYGSTYAGDNMDLINLTKDTSFSPTPDQIQLLVRFMLDGDQWMIRGYAWDFSTDGRSIVDYGVSPGSMGDFVKTLHQVPALAPDRAAEVDAFIQRLTAQVSPATSGLTGNRAFWCADYMVHERPNYFLGIRVVSKRTHGAESGPGYNLQGYYLGTGVTCLMKTGKEYSGLPPLWNWRQLPGTTCAQSNNPYPNIMWGANTQGATDFVGGASDGTYGATAFDFNRDGIVAHKGWFCFDDEVVCLGAGITATVADPIDTTIEQNWHNGDVSAGKMGSPITLSATDPTDLSQATWLLHGTTGYVFPTAQNVKVFAGSRTTYPHAINAFIPASKAATGDVFTAWIEHGVKPSNASYSYIILPDTDATKIAAYKPPQIISNTAQQQIVWHPGLKLAEAIFYSAGSFAIPSGPAITVDQPCVVLVHSVKGTWQVTVSDPTQLLKQITVTVDKKPITFDLPQDIYIGKSVTKSLDGMQAASL